MTGTSTRPKLAGLLIGLAVVAGAATASARPIKFDDVAAQDSGLSERLTACAPRTEEGLVRCLDAALTPAERRAIVQNRFVAAKEYADLLQGAIEKAWFLKTEVNAPWDAQADHDVRRRAGQVWRDVVQFRTANGDWLVSPGVLAVETYWLSKNDCEVDYWGRLAHARAERASEDRGKAAMQWVIDAGLYCPFPMSDRELSRMSYRPQCDVEVTP